MLPLFSSLSGLQALKLRLQGVPQGGIVLEPSAGHVDTEEVAEKRILVEHWRAQVTLVHFILVEEIAVAPWTYK